MKKALQLFACCLFTMQAIAQPCTENINATSNGPVCPGKQLTLNVNIVGDAYQWSGPNNFIAGMKNPNIPAFTVSDTGSYYITVTKGGCVYTDTVVVTIKPKPAIPVLYKNTPSCFGDSIGVGIMTPGGTTQFYLVDPLSAVYSTTGFINKLMMAGNYKAYAINTQGCVSDTATFSTTLPHGPAKPVVALNKPACNGSSLSLSAYTTGGATQFLFWDPTGKPITNPMPNLSYANSGDYTCVAYNTSGCPSDTTSVHVFVAPTVIPGVAIYGNEEIGPFGSVTYTSNVSGAGANPTYAWMRNNIPITNATNTTYTAVNGLSIFPGDIISLHVMADTTPCAGTGISNNLTVSTNLGVSNTNNESQFSIYPNPNSGRFTIGNIQSAGTICITNQLGQIVYNYTVPQNAGTKSHAINTKLAPGIYQVKLSTGEEVIYQKMLVQ